MNVFGAIFSSRKVWIAIVALAVKAAVLFGADTKSASEFGDDVLILAGAVIAAIALEDAAEKHAIGGLTNSPPPAPASATVVNQVNPSTEPTHKEPS